MVKKNLKTEVKRLRLTQLEAEQLDKYLKEHNFNFSEFVNSMIAKKVMAEFPTVSRSSEPLDAVAVAQKSKAVRQPPKVDPDLLFQVGRVGNNLNQLAKSLNTIKNNQHSINEFSFFECLQTLSLIQEDVHQVIGDLPKIVRSEQAVKRARERALKTVKARGEVLDVL